MSPQQGNGDLFPRMFPLFPRVVKSFCGTTSEQIAPKLLINLETSNAVGRLGTLIWCPGRDLNPYAPFEAADFKSVASTVTV